MRIGSKQESWLKGWGCWTDRRSSTGAALIPLGGGCKAVLSSFPPATPMNSAVLASARVVTLGFGEDLKVLPAVVS